MVDAKSTLTRVLGSDTMANGMAAHSSQPVDATLPWGDTVTLNGAFFHSIEKFNPLTEISGYHKPLFIAQGTNDDLTSLADANALLTAHSGTSLLWTESMDHVFNAFSTTEQLDKTIDKTIKFLVAKNPN